MRGKEVRYYLAEQQGLEVVCLRGSRFFYPEHSHVSTYTASLVLSGALRLEAGSATTVHGPDAIFVIPPLPTARPLRVRRLRNGHSLRRGRSAARALRRRSMLADQLSARSFGRVSRPFGRSFRGVSAYARPSCFVGACAWPQGA